MSRAGGGGGRGGGAPPGQQRALRQVIDGCRHRVRTGVQWSDLPERFGPWTTVRERHRPWSADGTRGRLLQQVLAAAVVAGEIDGAISVDSTIVRPHQHAAGARTTLPPATGMEHQDGTPRQSLLARLVEVVREPRRRAARGAGSPART
ncbi:transposase [Streptomyces sp. NPDC057540]|uniref:transposase n=1 Tax=Streptomyces sp. NPDC057540 TaxID=3346160 RepID=UPI0036781E02